MRNLRPLRRKWRKSGRKNCNETMVKYHDEKTGAVKTITSGSPPYKTDPNVYVNQEHAEAVAKGTHRKVKRSKSKIRLDIPGNPYVAAGGLLELDKMFPAGMRGTVSIDRVEARCTRGEGYRLSIQASKSLGK